MKRITVLVLLCNLFFTYGQQTDLKKVKFAAHWLPQAQFAGYYIGVEKGIYAKHGLDVEVLHSSPGVTSQDMLHDSKVDFASMFLSTAMFLKGGNEDIVNVCQLSQKCAQLLVIRDTTVKEPSELKNISVGVWRSGFDEMLHSLNNKYRLNIEFVPLNSTVNLFLFGGIDVIMVMWYNEYHTLFNSGINEDELNTLFFSDYGYDIPEDGIYCLRKNYDKEMVKMFVEATLEAWDYTFEHKEEAIELVKTEMLKKHVAFNKAHQRWMLNRMDDLFNVKEKEYKPGQLLKRDFENAYKTFSLLGRITAVFGYNDFYYGIK